MGKYYEQAVACVKDYVLPAQRKLCEKCGGRYIMRLEKPCYKHLNHAFFKFLKAGNENRICPFGRPHSGLQRFQPEHLREDRYERYDHLRWLLRRVGRQKKRQAQFGMVEESASHHMVCWWVT